MLHAVLYRSVVPTSLEMTCEGSLDCTRCGRGLIVPVSDIEAQFPAISRDYLFNFPHGLPSHCYKQNLKEKKRNARTMGMLVIGK